MVEEVTCWFCDSPNDIEININSKGEKTPICANCLGMVGEAESYEGRVRIEHK